MDINDNKLKRFYTVSAAIGYILCSLYAFIYCASYGLVHLHLPISSASYAWGHISRSCSSRSTKGTARYRSDFQS